MDEKNLERVSEIIEHGLCYNFLKSDYEELLHRCRYIVENIESVYPDISKK